MARRPRGTIICCLVCSSIRSRIVEEYINICVVEIRLEWNYVTMIGIMINIEINKGMEKLVISEWLLMLRNIGT